MAYVIGDLGSGAMRLVQAGHPPPLLLRQDGTVEFVGTGGLPIGLVDDVSFEETAFEMRRGDRLLIYSDGFTEAEMRGGHMLGEQGLRDLFRDSARSGEGPDLLQDMFWRLTMDMSDAESLSDDVSATLLEFDPLPH